MMRSQGHCDDGCVRACVRSSLAYREGVGADGDSRARAGKGACNGGGEGGRWDVIDGWHVMGGGGY